MLALTGPVNEAYAETIKTMTTSTDLLNEAYQKQIQEYDKQKDMLRNNINSLYIELGQQIIPILVTVTQTLISTLQVLRERW